MNKSGPNLSQFTQVRLIYIKKKCRERNGLIEIIDNTGNNFILVRYKDEVINKLIQGKDEE